MMKAATLSLVPCLLIAGFATAWGQAPNQSAIDEAVHRQANMLKLQQRLIDARRAQGRGELQNAAKIYDEAWELVQSIGQSSVPGEAQQTKAGVAATRLELAASFQRHDDWVEADRQVKDVLRIDPLNQAALDFKRANDKLLAENANQIASPEVRDQVKSISAEKAKVATMVQDGKLYYEMGKLDEAETRLKRAVALDPQNQGAYYYLNLIRDVRYEQAVKKRELAYREDLVKIEEAWDTPTTKDLLPQPNPYARSTLIHTGPGRSALYDKLDRIRLDSVKFDGLPLGEVIVNLSEEAKRRDPERRGINFLINPNAAVAAAAPAAAVINPATGLPEAPAAPAEQVDLKGIPININPPLSDVRLADVLDAIVMVANPPVKYSVGEYAIVFAAKGTEPTPLEVRTFKVDPNTFYQGLQSVGAFVFGETSASTGGGGGGGGGFGGGGGGSRGGGGGQNQNTVSGSIISRVSAAPGGVTGGRQGGGGQQQGGQGGAGGGLKFLTTTNNMEEVSAAARNYFVAMGVDLNQPGKTLFFNDREGLLVVRATSADLDTIEKAIQILNVAPPQVNVKAKFVEVSQDDNKAFGFDWFLGNYLMNKSAIGLQGGTAPSFAGSPSTANPEGVFPGSLLGGTTIPPSASDQHITSSLRNSAPALFTLSGILTDPQFRVVMKAIENRSGADILASPEVTIISGRQAQMKAVEIKTVITSFDFSQQVGGGVSGATTPSDRNIKKDFQAVDPQEVLAKVSALPITEWSYKTEGSTRHIGPMAQDFRAAFKLGQDDKSIAVVDANGIALAAIKGLNEKNEKLESQVKQAATQLQAKDAEIKALKQRLDKLEQLISRLDK